MTGPVGLEGLERRLEDVRERVALACERSGRSADGVEIEAVTKGHPDEALRAVARACLVHVGENRVGEAEGKVERMGRLGLCWHMVGHLQRNKAARAVRVFDEIESLDSMRLARRLQRELESAGREELSVLVQVNTSGEEAKGGFEASDPEEASEAVDAIARVCELSRLRVRGLMTMAPLTEDEEWLRRAFAAARSLFERCGRDVPGFEAAVLSMGMSNDFEIAVEEGSTRLRLGTCLVGERP